MQVKLFDRYVHQVGRRLPKKMRADVEAELHSSLVDTLRDRMTEKEAEDETILEAHQVAILEEFGLPAQVAAQYAPPHRYLVGPSVFNIYSIVVAAAAGGQTLLYLLLLFLMTLGKADPLNALVSGFVELFGSYVGFILAGFGSITLTFAILERVLPESAFVEADEKTWDPRTLPKIEDQERIETGNLIAESSLSAIALIAFNFFPGMIPLLSPDFSMAYLPLLNISWILTIGRNVVLLRQGRWQRLTRLIDFALTAYDVFIHYQIVTGPPVLTILPGFIKGCFAVGLVITAGKAIHRLYLVFQAQTTDYGPQPSIN